MRILVGMSGGVDSSVAAFLLKKAGHEVIGATMSIWDKSNSFKNITGKDACFSPHEEEDIRQAEKICKTLGIEYHVFDCTEQYKKLVLNNFKQEYLSGRTPNPCIWCNATIKFAALPQTAEAAGFKFDKFATGHYVRLGQNEASGRYELRMAKDIKKDQSYFLYRLSQEQLSKIMLPLGDYTKSEIREIARQAGFDVSDKPDSQDFYSGDVNDILQTLPKPGNFVNKEGKILGRHNGVWNFTIGQRRGMGISAEKPLYVIGLDAEKNEVTLGFAEDSLQASLVADNVSWLAIPGITEPKKVNIRLRSSQTPVPAVISAMENGQILVEFENLQKAVAPGQSVVFYEDDLVLGGGRIKQAGC